jgi:hypothetical protein
VGEKIQDSGDSRRIKVFISNSYLDRSIAMKVRNRLGEYGINVYIAHNERDVSPLIQEKVLENISNSSVFVPLLTKNFFASEWGMQESGAAVALQKTVISVSVDADPVGYLSRYDSIKTKREPDGSVSGEDLSNSLLKAMFRRNIIGASEVIDGLVNAMSLTEANYAAQFLKDIDDAGGIDTDSAGRLFIGAMDNLMIKGSFKASKILSDILLKYKDSLPRETIELLSQKKIF